MKRNPARLALLTLWWLTHALPSHTIAAELPQPEQPAGDVGSAPAEIEQPPEPDADLASPRATLSTFLDAMNASASASDDDAKAAAFDRAIKCVTGLGAADRSDALAIIANLKNALDRIERVNLFSIPADGDVRIASSDAWTYFPDENKPSHEEAAELAGNLSIVLVRDESGEWRFSAQTADDARRLFDALAPLSRKVEGSDRVLTYGQAVRNIVPSWAKGQRYVFLEIWQWIGLGGFIFLGLVVDLLLRGALFRAWNKMIERQGKEPDAKILKRSVRPFGLFIGALIWYGGLFALDLPTQAMTVLKVAANFVLILAFIFAAYRIVDVVGEFVAARAARTATKFDDLLVPLVRKTLKILIAAMGVVYLANSLNIEILPLLTGLGIGGLAFAFAAKDTIENFFGSIAVIADRPFEVGDWVVINDTEGTVEKLGLRSTRVRTFYNSLITIPNSTLVRATVDNYGRRRYRRYKTNLSLTYDTPPDRIEAFCEGVRELIRVHPYTRKDYYHVWLNKFSGSSLDVLLYMFFETPEWATELRERHRFMLNVLRLAEDLGVEFAFPTQTLHLHQPGSSEDQGDAPNVPIQMLSERRALAVGRRRARTLTSLQPWRDEAPPPVEFPKGQPPLIEIDDDPDTPPPVVNAETTES